MGPTVLLKYVVFEMGERMYEWVGGWLGGRVSE